MNKYIVSAMIQSGDKNAPVQVQWYKGDDLAVAITAMAQAAVHDSHDSTVPNPYRPVTLGVTLSIKRELPIDKTGAPLGTCLVHEGTHEFTDGSDGDVPCSVWRAEM